MNREIDVELIKYIWQEIRNCLDIKKQEIFEEIKSYPPPIPACDVQFNYLLEERTRLSQELNRLDTLFQQSLTGEDAFQWIERFIQSSTYINGELEEKIRSSLKKAYSET